ncbi:hypothetical protein C0989_002873 [Termitomyces sp. Mn162]|nr:hypothetical protein C0989_002873 [Termitomyces sp. Mn162]
MAYVQVEADDLFLAQMEILEVTTRDHRGGHQVWVTQTEVRRVISTPFDKRKVTMEQDIFRISAKQRLPSGWLNIINHILTWTHKHLAASISAYLSAPGTDYDYDFTLLSVAVSLVYAYGIGLPVLLWLGLRYLGVGEWSVVEAVAVWGYAQFVWIPVSILCVIPVPIVRWVLVFLAFASSGYFLVTNVYPILASAEAKATRLVIILIAVLHAALALTFKILFFSYYVVQKIGADIPIPGGDVPAVNTTVTLAQRALFML